MGDPISREEHEEFRKRIEAEDNRQNRRIERKSTRLNSSHVKSSYSVFCLKKKKKKFIINL
mgnify:CR=1 FL=1